jgi:hypothetical protein
MSGDGIMPKKDKKAYEALRLQVRTLTPRPGSAEYKKLKRSEAQLAAETGLPVRVLKEIHPRYIVDSVRFSQLTPEEKQRKVDTSILDLCFVDFSALDHLLELLVPKTPTPSDTPNVSDFTEDSMRMRAFVKAVGNCVGYGKDCREMMQMFLESFAMYSKTDEKLKKECEVLEGKFRQSFFPYFGSCRSRVPDYMLEDTEFQRRNKYAQQHKALIMTGTPIRIDSDIFIVDPDPVNRNHEFLTKWADHYRKLANPNEEERKKYEEEVLAQFVEEVKEEPVDIPDSVDGKLV